MGIRMDDLGEDGDGEEGEGDGGLVLCPDEIHLLDGSRG